MQPPGDAQDEDDRLADLVDLGLLDTAPEKRFDDITRLASRTFQVPVALVSLVDRDRQWFKSRVGMELTETGRDVSFCGHAILGDEVFVVEDATNDSRFADNPLVTGTPRIVFYASVPLHGSGGHNVGTLCIIDHEPRTFSADDRSTLRDFGHLVEREMVTEETTSALALLKRTEARYQASFAQAPIGMAMVGLSDEKLGEILEINEALVELTGYRPDDAVGRSAQDFVHEDDIGALLQGAAAASQGQLEQLDREVRMVRADGKEIWVRIRSRRVEDDTGDRYGIVHITDISERKRFEAELARLALHDPLTGLANRRLLMERLRFALAGLSRGDGPVAVLYVDFDHFKAVNDTYGHEAGDTLIVEAASRLAGTVRTIDTAGRFGGDEFVLVCPDLAGLDAAKGVADRLSEAFTKPIDVGPAEVTLTLSGGIALTDDQNADPARLLSAADEALYKAKRAGRNRFELAERGSLRELEG
ncbi:MAG: diguanylate cyclase [Actinobacteria bacterium]|nr:diguanylate cyclase [Actinomycetota bacterium]